MSQPPTPALQNAHRPAREALLAGLAVALATSISLADDWTANFYSGGRTCSQNFYELNASGVPLSFRASADTKKRYQAANMTCGYWSVEAGAIRLMCPNTGFPGDRSYSWIENTAPREDGIGTITVVAARLGFAAGKVEISPDGKYNNWKEVGVFTPGVIRNSFSFDWSAPGHKFVFEINDPKMKFFRISPQHPPRNSCDRYLTITELTVTTPAAQESQCTSKEIQEDYFVYVADARNHRIQVFDSSGNFLRKWGSYGKSVYVVGDDGQFKEPAAISIGDDGTVYVADLQNHRIQVFDSSGKFLRKWGSWGTSDGKYDYEKGTGDGQFWHPSGTAIGTDGNVYVLDKSNNRVQVFDSSGKFLRKFGSYGRGNGQFAQPEDVTIDASGNVYISDRGNKRIQVFDSSGNFLRKWGSYGKGNGQLWAPEGMAIDASGNLYVVEQGNHRVQVFDSSGNFLRKFGSRGKSEGQFYSPHDIAIDGSGNIYVADHSNNRVQVFDSVGNFLRKWGSSGTGDGEFQGVNAITIGIGGGSSKPPFITPNCETTVVGSGAPVAVDARRKGGSTTLHLTQYDARNWTGDLKSFGINDDGNPGDRLWSAATQLDNGVPGASSRVLLTWGKPVGGKDPKTDSVGAAFRWNNLWPSQQSDLRTEADDSCGTVERAMARLDYLRGDKSNEDSKGYQFRKRESLLGAVVHSRAVYVGKPMLGWPGAKYAKFKTTHRDREPIIYAGANDGALHGFRAKDGQEVIGYFPASVFGTGGDSGLHYFTDPGYQHSYLVDGTPVVSDAFVKN
ncbi:MAG: PilC/PilY family type IV pilus protein, partial [Arenicellales bacterium]